MRAPRYLAVVSGVAAVLLAASFLVVCLVDPLWYFSGNQLTGVNYPFNERIAKFVQYHRSTETYDCAIFGSSRATTLNERDIEGYRCFNFAVSAGTVSEFVEMAKYLHHTGLEPKLVIVGADGMNFYRSQDLARLPAFIIKREAPPSILESYVSWDAIDFTARTLLGIAPLRRMYRSDLTGGVIPELPHVAMPECIAASTGVRPFRLGPEKLFRDLRAVWPEARYLGYVPPISVWDIAVIAVDGTLDSYLTGLHTASGVFDEFYDFTIPSPITANPAHTVDGDHYYRRFNRLVADRLQSRDVDFGLRVTGLTLDEYRARFLAAYRVQFERLNIPVGPRGECYEATNAR